MNLGELNSVEHTEGLLSIIDQVEPQVQAWAHLDRNLALENARLADALRASGKGSALCGVAVGLKDIIDTADLPTENGTVLHAGRRPSRDAEVVRRLRQAGAVIMGKTVTTELATYAAGKTRNPHRLTHTPGGSSSGSAAAVACGMVPLALGSQTNGSTIRPGAFCGVVSFKPSRDALPREGMLSQSPTFDTVGLFARSVRDIVLLFDVLSEPALHDPSSAAGLQRFGWFASPFADRLEVGVAERLVFRARQIGTGEALPADLPVPAEELVSLHRLIMEAEIGRSFCAEYQQGRERLSLSLQGQIQRGQATSDEALTDACNRLSRARQLVDQWLLAEGWDGWVMPSAPGGAPEGLTSTGDPIFCTLATVLDLPALQLPGLETPSGMPLGIQVVGRRGSDHELLNWALSRASV